MQGLLRVAWVGLLLILFWQFVAPNPLVTESPLNDKLIHAVVFLGLGLSGLYVWAGRLSHGQVLVPLGLYGALIEVTQHFVPGRHLEFLDWVADVAGLVIAAWFPRLIKRGNAYETDGRE